MLLNPLFEATLGLANIDVIVRASRHINNMRGRARDPRLDRVQVIRVVVFNKERRLEKGAS